MGPGQTPSWVAGFAWSRRKCRHSCLPPSPPFIQSVAMKHFAFSLVKDGWYLVLMLSQTLGQWLPNFAALRNHLGLKQTNKKATLTARSYFQTFWINLYRVQPSGGNFSKLSSDSNMQQSLYPLLLAMSISMLEWASHDPLTSFMCTQWSSPWLLTTLSQLLLWIQCLSHLTLCKYFAPNI